MSWDKRRAPDSSAPEGASQPKKKKSLLRKIISVVLLLVIGYAIFTMYLFSQPEQVGKYPWKWKMDQWKSWTKFAVSFTADGYTKVKDKVKEKVQGEPEADQTDYLKLGDQKKEAAAALKKKADQEFEGGPPLTAAEKGQGLKLVGEALAAFEQAKKQKPDEEARINQAMDELKRWRAEFE